MEDRGKPATLNARDGVQRDVTNMSPASRADFVDTPSHVAAVIDQTRIHVVAKGDTLATIATDYYGSADAGTLIFDANRDQLADPDRIRPGQMLKIPAKS
jgi:nucleoid-associated protein YgaU